MPGQTPVRKHRRSQIVMRQHEQGFLAFANQFWIRVIAQFAEQLGVRLGVQGGQCKTADIGQQTAAEGLFRADRAGLANDFLIGQAVEYRTIPETVEVKVLASTFTITGNQRKPERQIAHNAHAQHLERIGDGHNRPASVSPCRIGRLEQPANKSRVGLDCFFKLGCTDVIALSQADDGQRHTFWRREFPHRLDLFEFFQLEIHRIQ